MIKKLLILIVLVILAFTLANNSYATVYFKDDFSSDSIDNWELGLGNVNNSWSVNDGRLYGSVGTNKWAKIYAKWIATQETSDYKLEADVENVSGVDQIFHVRVSEDRTKYYQVDYRYNEPAYTIDSNNITLYKFGDEVSLVGIYPSADIPRKSNIEQNKVNKIKIEAIGKNIKVYFNNDLVIDYTDNSTEPLLIGGVGLLNWGGSCPVSVNNYFDNIVVSSLDYTDPTPTITVTGVPTSTPTIIPTNTPTSIPTITPTSKRKIIILPGLGASWNSDAMVYNQSVPDDSWKMTPYVNNYKRLISSLEKNDLTDGVDFYIWNYDWRKPLNEIVSKLNQFIDNKISSGEKFYLIGHSLGGLTARIWAQNHQADQRLERVITLGSPHLGAVDTYEIWNGAKINSGDITGIALNILLALQSNQKITKVETIRSYSPIIRDLLPVFDYVKKCNKTIKFSDLTYVNNYLDNQNKTFVDNLRDYKYILGVGEKTKEWIELEKSNYFDKYLGIWPDGRVSRYLTGNGDNTVLKKSAILGEDIFSLASNHGDIVEKAVPQIMSDLGLTEYVDNLSDNNLNNKLVFFIGSPAELNVKCDNGPLLKSDNQGFLIVDSQESSKCELKIVGTGKGKYHLVTGKSGNQNSYRYYEDNIEAGITKTIIVDGYNGIPLEVVNDGYFCNLIKKDAVELLNYFPNNHDLKLIIDATKKCNIQKILEKTVDFRKDNKEIVVTNRMIDNIRDLLRGQSKHINIKMVNILWQKTLIKNNFKELLFSSNLTDTSMKTKFLALNYQKISELIEEGNRALTDKNYALVMADIEIINKLNFPHSIWVH